MWRESLRCKVNDTRTGQRFGLTVPLGHPWQVRHPHGHWRGQILARLSWHGLGSQLEVQFTRPNFFGYVLRHMTCIMALAARKPLWRLWRRTYAMMLMTFPSSVGSNSSLESKSGTERWYSSWRSGAKSSKRHLGSVRERGIRRGRPSRVNFTSPHLP